MLEETIKELEGFVKPKEVTDEVFAEIDKISYVKREHIIVEDEPIPQGKLTCIRGKLCDWYEVGSDYKYLFVHVYIK